MDYLKQFSVIEQLKGHIENTYLKIAEIDLDIETVVHDKI